MNCIVRIFFTIPFWDATILILKCLPVPVFKQKASKRKECVWAKWWNPYIELTCTFYFSKEMLIFVLRGAASVATIGAFQREVSRKACRCWRWAQTEWINNYTSHNTWEGKSLLYRWMTELKCVEIKSTCMYVCTFIVSLLTNKMFPADKKCELIKNMIQKYDK